MSGDVTFSRACCVSPDGGLDCPLDAGPDLPRRDRLSPPARSFLVVTGGEGPFARATSLLELAGGSCVSLVAAMSALRSAGTRVRDADWEAAILPYRDGTLRGGGGSDGPRR